MAYSPDGRRLIGGCADGTVKVWDAETGKPLWILRGNEGPVLSVALSRTVLHRLGRRERAVEVAGLGDQ